jgi:hypothetical protein
VQGAGFDILAEEQSFMSHEAAGAVVSAEEQSFISHEAASDGQHRWNDDSFSSRDDFQK